MTLHGIYIDSTVEAYLDAMFWADVEDNENFPGEYDFSHLSKEFIEKSVDEVSSFESEIIEQGLDVQTSSQIGHDFWLTRNGHGAGFWDRGLDEIGDKLTKEANKFGEVCLYLGDDGLIYA